MVMSICQLGLFVELVLVGTSLVLYDSVNGVKDLLVGLSIAGAIAVEDFIPDNNEWYTTHVLPQEFTEILHETFIIFVIPNFEGIDIDFVFSFGR